MFYVLDLDDTLYLERDYVRSGFKAVDLWLAGNLNVTGFSDSAWNLFEKGSRGNIFDKVLEEKCLTEPGIVKKLVDIYRSHDPEISLLPDAVEFLKQHDQNFLAIITDGYSKAQWNKIKVLGLESYVSCIVVTGDWGKKFWKPHTRAFSEVMKHRSPRECIYIADNPEKDFIAPAALGWAPSIRIRRSGGLHYDLKTPGIVYEISTFTELK